MPVTVLWVGRDVLPLPFEVLAAADAEAALQLLGQRQVDAMVARMRLPAASGLELLRRCAEKHPEVRRILLAAYDDLPEIVRQRGLVARVVPESAPAERIAQAVREALQPAEELSVSRSVAGPQIEELLRWTAARLAQTRGAVVRPVPADPRALQLQFVLPRGKRIDALRQDVVKEWLWPLKPRDGKPLRKDRKHPAVQLLGGASPESEIYARGDAYLALLPWQREARLTAVLGVTRQDAAPLLREVHAEAISHLSEFALPDPGEASGVGQAVPEYDWILTPDYIGPDRRQRPTGFVNRFIFFGRRRRVPSRIARTSDHFVDVPHRRVWRYAAAYVVLAAVDTLLTWWGVRSGLVREANPLLRPLVLHHPWWFLAAKNALAVGAFAAVVRFQLFRHGMWALRAAVALYALLDLYWLWLLH